jgi:cytochrome c-type biogenesis protein CcmH/NrfF
MKHLLVSATFLFLATSVFAQSPSIAESKDPTDLFSRIWSPYCHGISLLECPSSQAEDLRKEIRVKLTAGASEEEIFTELNKQHGGLLRMEPRHEGRESLAYWIPWTTVVLALIFVVGFWLRRKKKFRKKRATPPNISRNQNSKILEDLKARL